MIGNELLFDNVRILPGTHPRLMTVCAADLLLIWWGYPIVFGFCEGANYASITAEVRCPGCSAAAAAEPASHIAQSMQEEA